MTSPPDQLNEQQSDSVPLSPLPPSLHDTQPPLLNRCTYDEYIQLCDSIKENHDLVSGYLVHNPNRSDFNHSEIVKSLTFYLLKAMVNEDKAMHIYPNIQIYIPSRTLTTLSTQHSSSPFNSPSSSSSSYSDEWSESGEGKRKTDLCVFTSSPKTGPDGYLGKDSTPFLIIEITGNALSRKEDFELNWEQYYRAGVKEYIIIDRDQRNKNTVHHRPCIVVGKQSHSSWPRTSTGYSDDNGEHPLQSSKSGSSDLYYHRKVYEKNDESIVECSFLKLKAREMLFPQRMEDLLKMDIKESMMRKKLLQEELQFKNEQLRLENEQLRFKKEQLQCKKEQLQCKEDEKLKLKAQINRISDQVNGNGSPPRKVADRKSSPKQTS